MRELKFLLLALSFILSFSDVFALDSTPADPSTLVDPGEQSLTQLSSNINEKLRDLKNKIDNLRNDLTATTASLTQASEDLKISESERRRWAAISTTLSASLDSINAELNSSLRTITVYKTKVEERNRQLLVIGIIGAVIILFKIAAFILYARRVPIPRWLDILL
ncbi:MAG TPA: hypothetical protein DEQ14_11530 [Treponema sp.]|nr:hypothetical protein [Treponema sp.]